MLDFLPLSIRYPSLALLALFVVLIAFSAFPCALLLRYKLRKRAASRLRFLDEPALHEAKANDDAIAVVRGRLVGVRDDKPIAHGTVVLDAKGTELVSSDCALKLNRPEGQITTKKPKIKSHEKNFGGIFVYTFAQCARSNVRAMSRNYLPKWTIWLMPCCCIPRSNVRAARLRYRIAFKISRGW
jgi:hypothetical protein